MPKNKVDKESTIVGTPVTSEDLKEQGIENYGESIEGNAKKAAEEVEEVEKEEVEEVEKEEVEEDKE